MLAYGITWIAWLLANLIDLGASNAFSILGGAGPALSGLIVSAVRRPESSGVPAGRRLRLFCITGLLIMVLLAVRRLWFAQALVSIVGRPNRLLAYPGIMAFLADLLAAGVLALFFSGVDSPLQGVRDYLRSLDPRRQPRALAMGGDDRAPGEESPQVRRRRHLTGVRPQHRSLLDLVCGLDLISTG